MRIKNTALDNRNMAASIRSFAKLVNMRVFRLDMYNGRTFL